MAYSDLTRQEASEDYIPFSSSGKIHANPIFQDDPPMLLRISQWKVKGLALEASHQREVLINKTISKQS